MSRKQSGKHVRKKFELEKNKKDERAARRALAKDQKNLPPGEDEFVSFSKQLQGLGLQLREVSGDGNCLFRALADQMEGHSRNHLRLREETVQYMMTHRQDFEPFVEDDVPFTKHVLDLAEPGTFAGNDAIVAFARSQQAKVVIHQLNAPLWEINGSEKPLCPEFHIAYRWGDHYDSVRHIADNSKGPALLRIANLNKSRQFGDGKKDLKTSPLPTHSPDDDDDDDVILNSLTTSLKSQEINLFQSSSTSLTCTAESLESELRNQSSPCDLVTEEPLIQSKQSDHGSLAGGTTRQPKLSNKQRKEQRLLERKKKQEERHRQKFLQGIGSHDQNQNLPDTFTLVPALNTLSI